MLKELDRDNRCRPWSECYWDSPCYNKWYSWSSHPNRKCLRQDDRSCMRSWDRWSGPGDRPGS